MINQENEELYNLFCSNVRKIMYDCEISITEMSKKIGMSVAVFGQKLRNYRMKFNLWEMKKICDELDESIDDMLQKRTDNDDERVNYPLPESGGL